ncbi:MAG TPA: carboxypeptidase-like regulatory domain-containing protein [Bryobacteraceae bacterium]|jgi:hypothetical protein
MDYTFLVCAPAKLLSAVPGRLAGFRTKYIATLTAIFVLFGLPLVGQTFGTIEGQVKDTSGGLVPNARITVVNTGTNAARIAQTNANGAYVFPDLVPGSYSVRAEFQGFKSESHNNLLLQVTQTLREDFTLQPGQLSEQVVVSASAEQLNTDNATVGTTIDQQHIVDMPLNGRDYLQLVTLSNNVTSGFSSAGQSSRQGGTRAADNSISVGGQRASFNHYTLDGVENTDVNFNLYLFQPSVDAVQEFRVQSGVYPAEFGREASQVNVNTRPGTNQYHGALYEFFRNSKLDALPFAFTSNPSKVSPFKWNQYGFTLDGPLSIPKVSNAKDKLFFMVNYEGFNQRATSNSLYNVPTPAMRNGDFSGLLGPQYASYGVTQPTQLYYPTGRAINANNAITGVTPIPGNIIPTSLIPPQSLQMLQYNPLPNQPAAGITSNYLNTVSLPVNKNEFMSRIDWVESSKSTWFGRYSWTGENANTPTLGGAGDALQTNGWQYMISNTRIFTPSLVNEFRFSISKFYNAVNLDLSCKQNVVAMLGLPGLNTANCQTWGIPQMRNVANGISGWGDDTNGPYILQDGIGQAIDNFSYIHGNHSFRFGAEVRRDRFNQLGNEFPRGAYSWNSTSTSNPNLSGAAAGGYGFAGYMLGSPTEVDAAYGLAFIQMRGTSQAYYFDDTWRVNSKLTMTMGLRYELTPPLVDKSAFGGEANAQIPYFFTTVTPAIQQNLSQHPVDVRVGSGDFYAGLPFYFPGVQVARDGRLGPNMYRTDFNDWAPRLGIAWNPTPKWVVRLGVGLFYSQDSNNSKFDLARTLGGKENDVNNNVDARIPSMTWTNFVSPGALINIPNPTLYGIAQDIRTPRILTYLLNVQRQLSDTTMLEFGYLGSQGRHLWSLYDANEKTPSATGSVPSRSPFPEIGIIQTVQGGDNSNYNSGDIKITKRLSSGLTVLSSYTYSKSLDDASAIRGQGDNIFPANSRCLKCDYGLSAFDIRHRWVTSLIYSLPFGSGRKFLNRGGIVNILAGGWQLGSIYTLQSGLPGYPTPGVDQSNTANGNGRDRLNATGQPVNLPNPTTSQWFNTAAFSLEPFGTFGNAGRNVIPFPGHNDWDFSAFKNFKMYERSSLQLRVDAFNFLNHPNWGNPGNTFGATFGKITSTFAGSNGQSNGGMREIQLSLKLLF